MLIEKMVEHFPECCSLEMESFKLLSLAALSKDIYGCAAAIGCVDRNRN